MPAVIMTAEPEALHCSGRRSLASYGGLAFAEEGGHSCPRRRKLHQLGRGGKKNSSLPGSTEHRHTGHLPNDSARNFGCFYRYAHLEVDCAPRCVGAFSTLTDPMHAEVSN